MRKALTLLALAFSASAFASDSDRWLVVDASKTKTVSLDLTSIVERGGKTRAWTKTDQKAPTPLGSERSAPRFIKIVGQLEADCANREMRRLTATFYSKEGKAIMTVPEESTAEPVIPESIGESMLGAICAARRATSTE